MLNESYITGFAACYNEVNATINAAVAHMDSHKSAQSTVDAVNMILHKAHEINAEVLAMKRVLETPISEYLR